MTRMKITGVLLMVLLSVVRAIEIDSIVNGPATLPCDCSGNVVQWTIFSPIKNAFANCTGGKCEIEPSFKKRFSFSNNTSSGNFSISINSTLYNDNGKYRCICDGKEVSARTLNVYDPCIKKVSEGENISLPCSGDTRELAADVQWKKDGKILLEYPKTNEISAGRFSISNQSFQDGDLSLHISSVELSDAGFYFCRIHRESLHGQPPAVQLIVEKRQQEHQPAPNCYIQGIGVGIGVVGAVLLAVNGLYLIVHKIRCRCPHATVDVSCGGCGGCGGSVSKVFLLGQRLWVRFPAPPSWTRARSLTPNCSVV